jgi:predicted transcriptional regulator
LTENTFVRREKRELEVLRLLSGGSMRYIALQTAFVKRTNDSPGIFNDVFYSLVRSGRIVKCDVGKLAPYRLTEKGKLLLEALS